MLRPSRRRHRIRGRQRTLHAFSSAPAKTAAARRRFEIDSLSQAFLESISWLESAPCQYEAVGLDMALAAFNSDLKEPYLIDRIAYDKLYEFAAESTQVRRRIIATYFLQL